MSIVHQHELDDSGPLAFLAEASEVLGSSLDYETTLASLARLAVPYLADWCVIDIVDDDGPVRRLAVAHSDPSKVASLCELHDRYPPNPNSRHGVMQVIRTGQPEIAPEIHDEWIVRAARDAAHLQALRDLQLKSYICAPLVARSRVLGTLTLASATPARRYGAKDLAFAENLARRAATAVDHARMYQDATRAGAVKDRFLRAIGHELRASVNVTLGWIRLLRASSLDPTTLERALSAIERTSRFEARVIDDIQDACSIETGDMMLTTEPLDLVALVGDAVEEARATAQSKRLPVELISSSPACRVVGDRERLRRVWRHLLSNAVKFTGEGGRIEVAIERRETHVEIRCHDTGRGISAEFLPYVFDCFQQETSSRDARAGLGIGLAVARRVVELHGGRITAESPGEGLGATITVTLPVVPAAVERSARRAASGAAGALQGLRILLVEDEADARELITQVLEHHRGLVTAAASAREALTLLTRSRYDVLVSDIGMPQEDGFALIRKVRDLPEEKGGKIPAIALTAYGGPQDRTRALLEGFQVHLSKPVPTSELVSIITAVTRAR